MLRYASWQSPLCRRCTLLLLLVDLHTGLLLGDGAPRRRKKVPAATSGQAEQPQERIVVEIFYESLCPSCQQLVGASLQKIWQEPSLAEHVDLRMYPFGNSLMTTSLWEGAPVYSFTCQHGEAECLGNVVEACASHVLQGPGEYIPFMGCMENSLSSYPVEDSARACAEQLQVDIDAIVGCVVAPNATEMMASIATYTASAAPAYVPWVLIDGRHYDQADFSGQLWETLCAVSNERGEMPAACLSPGALDVEPISFAAHLDHRTSNPGEPVRRVCRPTTLGAATSPPGWQWSQK